ncbi:Aspartyl protease [Chitinophaga sp. CF118]|nr:Aspartyl protease [Chitinophaga sp. CF118]
MCNVRKYIFAILICLPALVSGQDGTNSKVVATLPFRMYDRYLIIPATVTTSIDTLHFIFDTGAEITTMNQETAKTLKLESTDVAGMSGTDDVVIRVPTSTISLLYLSKTRIPFVKVYLENLKEFRNSSIPIDGIIGVDLLKTFIVTIDYEHQQLLLYRAGKTPPEVKGKRMPLSINFKTPAIEAMIELPDGKTIANRFHFISGGEYGILFNWPFVEKYHLNTTLPIINTDKVQDLFKVLTYTNITIPFLAMGAYRVEQVPASYSPDVDDAGSMTEVAGSIGFFVWKQFRTITINYNEKELFLEK